MTLQFSNISQSEPRNGLLGLVASSHADPQVVKWQTLLAACHDGNKFLVQTILLSGVNNINCRDVTGNTPLIICATKGYTDIARLLLRKGADVNCWNGQGNSALICAVLSSGSTELVRLLIDHEAINVYHKNSEGDSCLTKALARLDFDLVRIILRKMFTAVNCISNATQYKKCIFEAHFLAEKLGVRRLFLYIEHETSQQTPALLSAIFQSDLNSVTFLLEYGLINTDVNLHSPQNFILKTLKFYEERKTNLTSDDVDIVRALLKHDKEISFNSKGEVQILGAAARVGKSELLDLICYYVTRFTRWSLEQVENAFGLALLETVKLCRCDLLRVLLRYCPDLLHRNIDTLPVEKALIYGCVEFIDTLLQFGIPINVSDSIMICINNSQLYSLEFIVNKLRHEAVNVIKDSAFGVLHKAVAVGDIEIVSMLIYFGADVNGIFQEKTPLMFCRSCQVALVLMQLGADINLRVSESQSTAILNLFSVAFVSECLQQRNLLTHGFVYLDKISEQCIDRFILSIKELIHLFIKEGARIEDKNADGETVLMLASKNERFGEVLEYLLESGSDPNNTDTQGRTALHIAASENCLKNMKILLCFNADVNSKCHLGMSCMHIAVRDNNQEIMKLLIAHGADVNVRDNERNTPLLMAAGLQNTKEETLTCLIKSDADLNHRNNDGNTALMVAASVSFLEIFPTLCDGGADVNMTNDDETESVISIMVGRCIACPLYLRHDVISRTHYLLDRGASAECVKPKHILELIHRREYKLLQKLVFAGTSPFELNTEQVPVFAEDLSFSQILTVSPFSFALLIDNTELARYFSEINFLTHNDIAQRERFKNIQLYLNECRCFRTLKLLDDFYCKPLSLETMCLITVSSAIGPGVKRRDKIKSLPIPNKFKDQLSFRTQEVIEMELYDGDSYDEDYDEYDDDFYDFFDDSSGYDDDDEFYS